MFNNDNVTNKMQPAFKASRRRVQSAAVRQRRAGRADRGRLRYVRRGPGCHRRHRRGANDGLGLWEITIEPLADDGYDITLEVEDAAGNVTVVNPIFNPAVPTVDIVIDTLEPNTPFLDLLDDTGRHNNDNITKDNTPHGVDDDDRSEHRARAAVVHRQLEVPHLRPVREQCTRKC